MADSQEEFSIDSIFERAVHGSNVSRYNDLLVLALHASLLSEQFECISVKNENLSRDQTDDVIIATPTNPVLPESWNESPDVYILQYKTRPPGPILKCLIKILPLGDVILINALSTDDMSNVITVSLPTNTYIKGNGEKENKEYSISDVKNVIQLFSLLDKEVTQKLKRSSTSDKDKKKDENLLDTARERANVRNESRQSSSSEEEDDETFEEQRPHSFFDIGSGDLSPFGGPGGSGMLMDPLRDGRLGPRPPGFHPPGARYDPLSPFEPPRFHPGRGQYGRRGRGRGGPGRMFGPDPDHLPPPGYDDMFM